MNINKVVINNYKSIGNERNTLFLDPNTTAIIGKNESGKSNVLDAVGNLPYFGKPNANYYRNKNRGTNQDISVVLEMQLSKKEVEKYNVSDSKTRISFTEESIVLVSGGLSEMIAKDKELMAKIEEVVKTKSNRGIWNIGNNEQSQKQHSLIIDCLKESSSKLLLNFERAILTLKQQVNKTYDKHDEITNILDDISTYLSKYYQLFPKIFYREADHQLEYSYDLEKIKEILKAKKDIFYRLMLAAKIDEEEIIRAFEERVEGDKQNIREEIEQKIACNIGERFNEFYQQETVQFKTRFEGNTIKFLVNTNKGKTMLITERSNGLRWYLSLFVDILASDFGASPVLFLFDEPGVYLHVNAQKELLNLFEDLAGKGHQVIYTTHSPSMIDGENILNVRVVEKNDRGNTVIYRSGYDQRLSIESKMETLSPLIKAIGADLRFNLGPQTSKINIITEGISDYMYLKALMFYLNVEDQPNIIPSAGVESIDKIVSILMGWGCKFRVLLDYDFAGRKEYMELIEKLDPSLQEQITFVNGEDEPSLEKMKSSPITIEDMISQVDFNKLSNSLNDKKDNKVLVAKEFYDKVLNGEIKLEQETLDSFVKVFDKLNIVPKVAMVNK